MLERVRKQQPLNLPLFKEALSAFRPNLVVNKVPAQSDANDIVSHVQKVSKKMLSVDVRYLGNISYQREIEKSVFELVPAVSRHPKGKGTISNFV